MLPESRPSPRAARMSPDERRAAIVDALVPVVVERGLDLSTKEIASAAGVAEGTLFRAFPDKKALLAAVVVAAVRRHFEVGAHLAEQPSPDLPLEASLEDRLRVLVDRVLERSGRTVQIMSLLHQADPDDLPWGDDRPPRHGGTGHRPEDRSAHRAALVAWTERILGDHVHEVRVPVERLVDIVRALAVGDRVPPHAAERRLDTDTIVDVLLHGVATPTSPSHDQEPSC